MKKYIFYAACLMLLGSCEDILDIDNPSSVSPAIWNSEASSTLFLNKLYNDVLPGAGYGANASITDNAPGGGDFIYGNLTIESVKGFSLTAYRRIRDTNMAIEEIEAGSLTGDAKDRVQGQAFFLRAWQYWELVKLYGGVPMVFDVQDPYVDNLSIPRNSTSESINLIVEDLDKAIEMLPGSWSSSERGRVTRGAAAALKSRILLFWASPQFNPSDAADRWERAYTASKEAKELLESDGYGLYNSFKDIFLVEGNKEVIFARLFEYSTNKTHGWENSVRPRIIGADGGTSSNPTLSLVNAFPMENGMSIDDPASGYDEVHYWENRDPRFYATIVYNGATYEVSGFPAGRKQWTYYYTNSNGQLVSVEPTSPTTTGFYTRKAINPEIPQTQVKQTGTDWVEIRFAEVLLNLAEAANETGRTDEAYNELIKIRQRAGIEAGDGLYGLKANMTKDEMREAILHERRIEFAFEDKRYWDLRRHNLFEEKLNGTRRYGVRTILKPEINHADFLQVRDQIDLSTEFENYFMIEPWLKDDQFEINYPQPLYNFFAIPQTIRERSPALEQTIGWGDGTFDPLK